MSLYIIIDLSLSGLEILLTFREKILIYLLTNYFHVLRDIFGCMLSNVILPFFFYLSATAVMNNILNLKKLCDVN